MSQIQLYPGTEARALAMIEAAQNLAVSTKAKYKRAIENYLDQGGRLTDPDQLRDYAATISPSGRAFLKAAIRLWADRTMIETKAQANPENAAAVTATIYRLEAITAAIETKAQKGEKAHFWLSQAEVKKLLATCSDDTLICQRDKLVLGLLVGAGLRRAELAALQWQSVKYQPYGVKMRTVLEIRGKGAKDRVVPIGDKLAAALDRWQNVSAAQGNIARNVTKGDHVGESLSAGAIFQIVNKAGAAIGKPKLAPHDLRRTYAQIGYEAGVPITQISRLLGHSSVATTQRYLNLELNLETTISDFVPFE